jgi:hypothetical protein
VKVSMDGLRKNLTGSFNRFVRMLKDEDYFGNSTFEKLSQEDVDALDELRRMIGGLNYVYSDDEDFNDLVDLKLEPVYEEDEDDEEENDV